MKTIIPYITIVAGVFAAGCNENGSKQVERGLENCPAWTVTGSNRDETQRITASLEKLSAYNIEDIRAGVEQFVHRHNSKATQDLDQLSKIFLLNRYLFAVPESAPLTAPVFGAWRSPITDDRINLLWPFTSTPEGGLRLTATFTGYTGEPYLALDEFDCFHKHFGIRVQTNQSH